MATAAGGQQKFAGTTTHNDYFLKLESIKGESTDDKHKGEIDVHSWSFGEQQPSTSAFGGGSGAGKVSMHDFQITKWVDASSPLLMVACASGQHFKEATLVCRKAGGQQMEFLKIKLTDVLISSIQTEFKDHGSQKGDLPQDTITLNFSKIEFEYKAQNPDGTPGANTAAGWDLKVLKKV